ncbi:glycoside hydrolase family 3 protein [Anaeromicropila herbilytica]|uniref:Beta-glucosidase n=1 Tax=Anaeromicropila herbilytica TaxID=2785025 RepID=A0A7R7IBU0_9FIRM|nr:glycoside hydrolase family 3 protein [Anaeromicropila herbilytica]BCN29194.1 beta-glucosidase [Anaeromicropila herbilytica]
MEKNKFIKKLLIAIGVIVVIVGAIAGGLYKLSQDGVLNMADVYATINKILPYFIPFAVLLIALIVLRIILRGKSAKTLFMVKWQSILVLVLAFIMTVNVVCFGPMVSILNLKFTKVEGVSEKAATASKNLTEQIADEGTVLLKNKDGMLPLNKDVKKLNVFGWASTNPCYGGTGSGSVDPSNCVTLLQGLTNAGYELNSELSDFYTKYCSTRPEVSMMKQDWTLKEPTADSYSDTLIKNAKDFSDDAVIVITRVGGEGADLPKDMSKVTYKGNKGDFEPGQTYLELSKTEKDMVDLVTKNFDNVCVVINAANPMELGWVDKYDSIKSVLWMAGPGQTGFNALGKILSGQTNPSGKLVDTYAYDLQSTPSYNNTGAFAYDNAKGYNFVNYVEGIYVGYRFYETYYLNNEAGYRKAVQYPFGYGLSYTSFEQKMSELTTDDKGNISFDVTVTNKGDKAGKDVVEAYYTAPYTEGGIEKSAVDLVKFAKTNELQPGESQTINIAFNEEDMASYDTNGEGSYVLDAGNYGIKIMSDSHTVIDEKTYTVDKKQVYNESNKRSNDKEVAKNEFEFAKGDVTYLSRANNFKNYKEATAAPTNFSISDANKANLTNAETYKIQKNDQDKMPVTDAKNNLKLYKLKGLDYDDPQWDKLLDELSVKDMTSLIALGGYQTSEISSIGKIATVDADGPAGFSSFFNTAIKGTAFPGAIMIAATWNSDLAKQRGIDMGEESKGIEVSGWYGPAMNIHRNAFAGRNFEYYSEDGVLSGVMAANEVSGAASKGLYAYIKHFALNDQETNRLGMLCTWSSEQAIRQIYLKPFEMAVKDGNASAVMSSFNYIGNQWAGGCAELLTNVLRDEWGFHGFVITDYFGGYGYMDADKAIRAGNDLMLSTTGETGATLDDTKSATAVTAMRKSSHNILYTVVNSKAYDNYKPGLHLQPWMKVAVGADVALVVILLGLEVLVVLNYRKRKDSITLE